MARRRPGHRLNPRWPPRPRRRAHSLAVRDRRRGGFGIQKGDACVKHLTDMLGDAGPAQVAERPADHAEVALELSGDPVGAMFDSLPMYLREIGRVPLLSAEDEKRLARAIEDGRAAQATLAIPGTVDDGSVAATVRAGRQARDQLTAANLRLVVSIARRYLNRGVPLSDLVQEGNLGLMHAVEKFDWRRGFKFSTYATWWIRQAITRSLADDARTIRIPVHLVDLVNKIARTSARLHQELGREPSEAEIAEALDLPVERVRELDRVSGPMLSLDGTVSEELDTSLADVVPDQDAISPEQATEFSLLREQLNAVLATLSPREHHVIAQRYGLLDGRERSLTDIGRAVGVTRERVRQVEAVAMRKLRQPGAARALRASIT